MFSVNNSILLGTIAGIEVRFEFTLAILCIFFIFEDLQDGGLQAAIDGTLFIMLYLICILLHELGHAFAGRAFRIKTTEVVLTFFGGYAAFERAPSTRVQEAAIALAGPAVNLAIAGLLYLTIQSAMFRPWLFEIVSPYHELISRLIFVNVLLGLFNLLPAYPLDGGQATRAALSTFIARPTARLIVARLGQVLALAIAILGIQYQMFFTVFIAAFLFISAMAEVNAVKNGLP
jgi:stage IV sporulation protein FB